MITRRLDWRSALQAWAREQVGKPFVWGQTDCGSLARDALQIMFGRDVVPGLPRYQSWGEAVAAKDQIVLFSLLFEGLGAQASAPAFMRAGDVVVAIEPGEDVGRESLMICLDGRKCLASTRLGVVILEVPPDAQDVVYTLWEVDVDG